MQSCQENTDLFRIGPQCRVHYRNTEICLYCCHGHITINSTQGAH